MQRNTNPRPCLAAETLGVLIGIGLYINYFRHQFLDFTDVETGLALLFAVGLLWWGVTRIDESNYTHTGLYWYRVAKPLWRALKGAIRQIATRIAQLDLLARFVEESQDRHQSRAIVDDFTTIAFDELAMDTTFRPNGDELDRLAEIIT